MIGRCNSSWNKWIVLSLSDYFQENISPDYYWIQGMFRPKNMSSNRIEIRYLGPDIISITQDTTVIHITINIQICTQRTPDNAEDHLCRVGNMQSILTQCISVNKYGSDPTLDDKSLLGHLQQISNVDTTSFGAIDPVSSIERSTVEATYKILL
jgi:hypothetical protein